jgi:hypothetical protein
MPGSLAVAIGMLVAAALLLAGGGVALRLSGARVGLGRRLAAARQVRLADLLAGGRLPERPVRVAGRVRCDDPILTPGGDRLVALHRDVEVRVPGHGWRTIERLRESRAFDLWDHAGSTRIDAAAAAEPLVAIPHVWRGSPGDLGQDYQRAVARLAAELGPPSAARSVTRMLSVIDHLLVLADVRRDADGAISLLPPAGGYVISSLELDDAMRLLGGPHKRLLLGAAAALGAGTLLLLAGAGLLLGTLLASA